MASNLDGRPVYVSHWLCKPKFVRWKKNHRRSRINKKWHRKYGAIWRCPGVTFTVLNEMMVCPCVQAALEKETERGPKTKTLA